MAIWKKSKSWGPFWSYQLNSTANSAHLPRKWAKWAELAVLFSWYFQNGRQDFEFFNCHGCQTFILYEIYCYRSPPKSWHNNSFLGSLNCQNRHWWPDQPKLFWVCGVVVFKTNILRDPYTQQTNWGWVIRYVKSWES